MLKNWTFPALMLVIALAGGIYSTACAGMTLADWHQESIMLVGDLEDLALLAEAEGKTDTAKSIHEIADAVVLVEMALAAAQDAGDLTSDTWTTIQAAMNALDTVAAQTDDSDIRIGVAAAKIALRRIQAKFPRPEPDK